MNRNYLLYTNKILLLLSVLFIFSCTSKIKNSDNLFDNESIEILSEIYGLGDKIKNHYKISVHYVGALEDGTEFDNSYIRNQLFEFQIGLNQVIPGWEIALMGMQVGGKKKFKIPPSLAYGNSGAGDSIPPNSFLIFDVEIINIKPPGYIEINSEQLLSLQKENFFLLMEKKFILIDIRTEKEWQNTGVIEGSYKISAFDSKGNLNPNFLKMYKKNVKENDYVVFLSDKGEISSILANGFVENLGMKNIYSLKGGIQEWIIKGNKINI